MNAPSDRIVTPAFAANSPLPDWPRSWYVVARSAELPAGSVRAVSIGGSEVVLFRTVSGALGAVDAHCPHMGAHLRHGTVRGEHLECALHCWRIGVDGEVVTQTSRAVSWPVQEQYGVVMLALGPSQPVPTAGNEDFIWTSVPAVDIAVTWHSLVTNAFDLVHLCTVHLRDLAEAPRISMDPGNRFTLNYVSRVRGRALSDRVMKQLSRDRISVQVRCHGAVTVVETDLGFTRTAAVLGMFPTAGGSRVFATFGIRRGRFERLRLAITRWLFVSFLRRDLSIVEGMQLRTDVNDATLQQLFTFLRSLRIVK